MVGPGPLIVVHEGRGEFRAVDTLAAKVGQTLPSFWESFTGFLPSIRRPVTSADTAVRAAEIAARYKPAAVLITADLDDGCPADAAPEWAAAVRQRRLPVPVAVVLFHREYETLAISVADSLAGRELVPGLIMTAPIEGLSDPETRRDAKGWLSKNVMAGVSYKPTVHQLPLTRLMRIDDLRAARLSSYRRFENALTFLADEVRHRRSGVYPSEGLR